MRYDPASQRVLLSFAVAETAGCITGYTTFKGSNPQ